MASVEEHIETTLVERVVPVRFVHVRELPDGNFNYNMTKDHHRAVLERTNQVFRSTGIQFVLKGVESVAMPTLYKGGKRAAFGSTCNTRACSVANPCPTGQLCSGAGQCTDTAGWPMPPCFWGGSTGGGEPNYSWAGIYTDFQGLSWITNAGGPITSSAPPLYTGSGIAADWMGAVTNSFTQPSEMTSWILQDDATHPWAPGSLGGGAFSDYPYQSRLQGFRRDPGVDYLGYTSTYTAHEYGHYWGLGHADDLGGIDPATNAPAPSYLFWDMTFCPGTITSPHTFPQSATQAASCGSPGGLVSIDRGSTGGGVPWVNCTVNGTTGFHSCKIAKVAPAGSCVAADPNGRCETWTSDDAPLKNRFVSKSSTPENASVPYGTNVMTYYQVPYDAPNRFSASQAAFVRKHLRYSQVSIDMRWTGAVTGRATLGSANFRHPTQRLDFDGDGKRDFAFWIPPTNIAGTGRFVVLLSKLNYSTTSVLGIDIGRIGVIPAIADYNGDGRSDIGFIEQNNATGALTWKWCPSFTGDPITGTVGTRTQDTTCPGTIPSEVFGSEGQTPIIGTDFDANSATGEVATYNPGTGTWSWKYIGGATVTKTPICVNWVGNAGCIAPNAVPLAGLYDNDGATDIAVYDPNNAKFVFALSSTSWNTTSSSTFPSSFVPVPTGPGSPERGGAVVVQGMMDIRPTGFSAYKMGRHAFALWDPDTGSWAVQWDPTSASTVLTCTAGVPGDIPLGGLGTKLTITPSLKRSELALFRSRGDLTGPSLLRTPSSPTWCDTGNTVTYDLGVVPQRRPVVSVYDVTGDAYNDIMELAREEGYLKIWTSDSGFTTSTSYTLPQAVVPTTAEFLLQRL